MPLEVNTDPIGAVQVIQEGNLKYDNLVYVYRYLMNKLKSVQLEYVYKEQNQVADGLAKEGAKNLKFYNTTLFVSPSLPAPQRSSRNS